MALALHYAARSDVGLLRDGNEDSAYAGPRLLAVADGMGGAVAGEVASSVVMAIVAALDEDSPGPELLDRLATAVTDANAQLRLMITGDPSLDGMGTTLTALLRAGTKLGLVHVGDSRCYLLRDRELIQITKDHSWVQALVDDGRITREEAVHHPQRSIILRVLDGRDEVDLDLSVREARPGDRYLLCSDGLSDVVSEDTIRAALADHADAERACDALIDLALRGGGPDNITCIVADVVDVDRAPSDIPEVVGAVADVRPPRRPHGDSAASRAAALASSHAGASESAEAEAEPVSPQQRGSRRGWLRGTVLGLLVLALLAGGAGVAYAWSQQQYYVGNHDGTVAIYRGVDQQLAGVNLSRVHERLDIRLNALPDYARARVENDSIAADDLADAQRIAGRLREEAAACEKDRLARPSPAPTTTPPTTTPVATPSSPGSRPTPTPPPTPTPAPTPSGSATASCGGAA